VGSTLHVIAVVACALRELSAYQVMARLDSGTWESVGRWPAWLE